MSEPASNFWDTLRASGISGSAFFAQGITADGQRDLCIDAMQEGTNHAAITLLDTLADRSHALTIADVGPKPGPVGIALRKVCEAHGLEWSRVHDSMERLRTGGNEPTKEEWIAAIASAHPKLSHEAAATAAQALFPALAAHAYLGYFDKLPRAAGDGFLDNYRMTREDFENNLLFLSEKVQPNSELRSIGDIKAFLYRHAQDYSIHQLLATMAWVHVVNHGGIDTPLLTLVNQTIVAFEDAETIDSLTREHARATNALIAKQESLRRLREDLASLKERNHHLQRIIAEHEKRGDAVEELGRTQRLNDMATGGLAGAASVAGAVGIYLATQGGPAKPHETVVQDSTNASTTTPHTAWQDTTQKHQMTWQEAVDSVTTHAGHGRK